MASKLAEVTLNETEVRYLAQIDFARGHESPESEEAALELTRSLLERDAIPEIRKRYFTDPRLNIGSPKMSRKQIFERNGTTGEDIFRNYDFLKYLKYFIYGPDLPDETIQGFLNLIDENAPITSGDVEKFQGFARSETRARRLDRRYASGEFHKLALESEINLYARNIRDAVMRLKV